MEEESDADAPQGQNFVRETEYTSEDSASSTLETPASATACGFSSQTQQSGALLCSKKEFSRKRNLIKETDSSSSCARPIYKHQNHTKKAFAALNKLRELRQLCDVQLVADIVEVPAHKVVLSSCSPYFHAMFTCELAECSSSRVVLQEVDGQALAQLVDFMYTGDIQVTEDSVQSLLPVASLLQLVEVEEACCDFLQSQLHPANSLGICAFADLHSCRDLLTVATQYTEQHFTEVSQHDEYMALPIALLCKLLSSDRLYVKMEEQVFEAAIRWLRHERASSGGAASSANAVSAVGGGARRLHLAPQVLEHVRLPLLQQDYLLQRIEDEELLRSDGRCKDLLIEALRYHLVVRGDAASTTGAELQRRAAVASLLRSPRTRQRTPVGLPKVLLVFGGQAPKAIRSVELYDFKDEKWYQAAEMPSRRCRCGVAVLDNIVYAIGGFNGSLRVRTVDCYDPVKDVWAPVASMEARRSTIGAAVLDSLVYAVGGFDGSTGLNTAEVYNPQLNEWRFIAPMSTRRSSVGVGVVKGLLYAVGGYDGASRQCLATVEAYDPKADAWTPAAEMTCRRSGAGVGVGADGLLYAVGGHDGPLVRKSVEVYNPELDIWTQVADMHLCRRNAGVVAIGGCLYVIGGDDGSTNLNSLECYDAKTNTWLMLDNCMLTGRSYAGVAIVDKYV